MLGKAQQNNVFTSKKVIPRKLPVCRSGVDLKSKKTPNVDLVQIPMTQSDIASYLGINKGNLSRIIKSLIDKGVIVRAVGFKEGINARAYSLYLNPHIIYSGDRDNIPEPLKTMFYKTPKALKNLPVRLF
jgi:DNA-binding Lrp family transcriptional regulator